MRLRHFMPVFVSLSLISVTSNYAMCAEVEAVEAAPRASQIQPMVAPVKRTAPQVASPAAKAASTKKAIAKTAVRSAHVQAASANPKKPNIKTASKGPAKKAH